MEKSFQKEFLALEKNIPDILGWIEETSMKAVSMAAAMKIQLVAEEAVVNVVNYAYSDTDDEFRRVVITIGVDGEKNYIELVDEGKPFNPLKDINADPFLPLDERNLGGWGRALMAQVPDESSYVFEDGKNKLKMIVFNSQQDNGEL